MDNLLDRIPPHNIDAEQSALGAMLLDKDAIYKVMEIIRPGDFYRDSHRLIFETILQLVDRNEPVDIITVTEQLRQDSGLEKVGGAAYVALLANIVTTAANADYYARIIWEKSLLRQLIQASGRIMSSSYESKNEATAILDMAEKSILEISQSSNTQDFIQAEEIVTRALEQIEEAGKNKSGITGLQTSFADLDRISCGLQSSDLLILAARPSMGKTALGLNIASNVALRGHKTIAMFSLEMSKEQLIQRVLSTESMIDQNKLRTGNLNDEEWDKLSQTAARIAQAPIYIDDTPGISVREMRSKARRLKNQHGLSLIVVDYLQLMQGVGRTENRQQEISEISRSLKGLAKELQIPVLALSQLSRAVEQRGDKRPIMSDLRESGSLEQDADVVMFIYRDEYYNPDSDKKGIAELIVAKQRNGPTGLVELGFMAEYTRFVNMSRREQP